MEDFEAGKPYKRMSLEDFTNKMLRRYSTQDGQHVRAQTVEEEDMNELNARMWDVQTGSRLIKEYQTLLGSGTVSEAEASRYRESLEKMEQQFSKGMDRIRGLRERLKNPQEEKSEAERQKEVAAESKKIDVKDAKETTGKRKRERIAVKGQKIGQFSAEKDIRLVKAPSSAGRFKSR